jgi:hypothetical protein
LLDPMALARARYPTAFASVSLAIPKGSDAAKISRTGSEMARRSA